MLIEAHTDPEVPPLPPHIRFEQAKQYLFSVFKGDPEAKHMIGQSLKHMAQRGRASEDDDTE